MPRTPNPGAALAHGPAALFVEEIVERDDVDASFIVCRGRVPARSPSVTDGFAGAWATLELAAQAAALLQTLQNPLTPPPGKDATPVAGYLVRVRGARFERSTVPADTPLVARVERRGGAGGLSLFSARVELDGEIVATAELGTFTPAD